MERRHVGEETKLSGYDTLRTHQNEVTPRATNDWSFTPSRAYDAYHRMHKILVGPAGGLQLESIAASLNQEWMPRYLNVAGWAAAEAALVGRDRPAAQRVRLLDQAAESWERAILSQEQINGNPHHEWLQEDTTSYRFALDLAFVPLMKALATGNVMDAVREQTFADTLAIAQASTVQRHLASQSGDTDAMSDHSGFGHECNTLLTLLYMNDPRYFPLPSIARAGTGYDYPNQTHDIMVINQHWGEILKIVPVEIKAATTLRDLKRYEALIVRGKMHLSVPGKYSPEHTLNAFAALYEGKGTFADSKIATHATSTMRELLQLYQKGQRVSGSARSRRTRFHNRDVVAKQYPEFSLDRAKRA